MTAETLQAGIIIPIDKPRQWTSFQVVNKIKSIIRNQYGLKKIKIGHAGTLDPLASGLLLVCIGKATKQIEALQSGDKEYVGTMVFGATTPCYDLEQQIDCYYESSHITMEQVTAQSKLFVGTIEQTPPLFSAVKIDGQRAYEYARKEEQEVSAKSKMVHIDVFEVSNYRISDASIDNPVNIETIHGAKVSDGSKKDLYQAPQGRVPDGLPLVDFSVRCGKGTYIRSLARDMGTALNSGAFLSALRRTRVGDYDITQAYTIEQLSTLLANTEQLP